MSLILHVFSKETGFAKTILSPACISSILILYFLLPGTSVLKAQTEGDIKIAQEYLACRGEVIFSFIRPSSISIEELSKNLSIDRRNGDTIVVYANEKQFNWFQARQIPFQIIVPHVIKNPGRLVLKSTEKAWNTYPSYAEYLRLMESFAKDYPGLCMLHEFGTSTNTRKLLALKISDNPAEDETEPVFFYTSTMHGDEATGFVLMLRLIDSLLTAYNSNSTIKQLVDDTEIWINPLANPDGLYFESDTFIFNSKRFNANNTDLNRNFPDPVEGDHPDGVSWQPETIAMMEFMKQQKIVLAANLHDGSELVNFPWDSRIARHADDIWYRDISRQFADTVQLYSPSGFFIMENNGITNGYDWYPVYGGRQDYVNYFLHGREVTIELSEIKSPDPSQLPAFWNNYKISLIGYLQQIHLGVHGMVLDAVTGTPVKAMIEISGYDRDSSQVFSTQETGEFYRLLSTGSFSFKITSPGYETQSIEFSLSTGEAKKMTVLLAPSETDFSYYPNPFTDAVYLVLTDKQSRLLTATLCDVTGRNVYIKSIPVVQGLASITGLDRLAAGLYQVKINDGSQVREIKLLKIKGK
jgi:hypothetical protein